MVLHVACSAFVETGFASKQFAYSLHERAIVLNETIAVCDETGLQHSKTLPDSGIFMDYLRLLSKNGVLSDILSYHSGFPQNASKPAYISCKWLFWDYIFDP